MVVIIPVDLYQVIYVSREANGPDGDPFIRSGDMNREHKKVLVYNSMTVTGPFFEGECAITRTFERGIGLINGTVRRRPVENEPSQFV
jgi:hypothetical protein